MKFKIQTNKKISVKQRNVLLSLFIENISFISTDEGITKIHYKNNEKSVFTTRILKEFEEELYEFGFVRVRSNFLVNIYFVKSINGGSSIISRF